MATRTALQNAASVASLMLTTDCMVADLPEDKKPGAPDMGMGGMDFQVRLLCQAGVPAPASPRKSPCPV